VSAPTRRRGDSTDSSKDVVAFDEEKNVRSSKKRMGFFQGCCVMSSELMKNYHKVDQMF